MNDQFDELAKSLAQSVTRRAALKKFGVGLAGLALASLGLARRTEATPGCLPSRSPCKLKQPQKCCSGICYPVGAPPSQHYGICF